MTEGWKRSGTLAAGAAALAVLAVLAAALWHPWSGRAPARQTEPSALRVQPVGRADFTQTVPWLGRVESRGAVTLVSTVPSRVTAILAQDGARVREGQPVFALGGPLLKARLDSARAREAALSRELALARQVALRQKEAARLRVVNENAAAAAESEARRLEAALQEARAERTSLDAQATVCAPVAGVLTDRRVNPGQDVEPGTALAEVTDPDRLRVAATLYVPAGVTLRGLAATATLGGRSAALTVVRVFPDQSPAGGSKVWMEFSGPEGRLRPGAEISGTVTVAEHRRVLSVPRSAVVYDGEERPYVFVERRGAYARTPVALGLGSPEAVEVTKGLEEGDRVVVEGAYQLYYRDFGKTYRVED